MAPTGRMPAFTTSSTILWASHAVGEAGFTQIGTPERSAGAAFSQKPQAGKLKDRKSTRLNSSHGYISYAVFCLKKKRNTAHIEQRRKRHLAPIHPPPLSADHRRGAHPLGGRAYLALHRPWRRAGPNRRALHPRH